MTNDDVSKRTASSPQQPKGRNISYQFLILTIVSMFVIRIQIFNCNVKLKEFHNEMTSTQHYELHHHKPRILVGIFSVDTNDGFMYRQRHRTLFQTWNDTRICSLSVYNAVKSQSINQCEFIYTFVIGANPGGPTELLQIRDNQELETTGANVKHTATSWLVSNNNIQARDIESLDDITLLNIRENMNNGKSQSWIAYSSTILANDDTNDFDYIAKWDDDSILLLPEYFNFVYSNLPNHKPYNSMFFVGTPFDKAHWEQSDQTPEERKRVESLYEDDYNRVHVYFGGQVYIMSIDLAQHITQEAIRNHCSYCEGVEDHDIASIAFHATSTTSGTTGSSSVKSDSDPHPILSHNNNNNNNLPVIKLLFVGRPQLFWKHPIKTNDEWNVIWQQERQRISTYH